eukprot:4442013-Lingulodinium_polyedra.AAC.1
MQHACAVHAKAVRNARCPFKIKGRGSMVWQVELSVFYAIQPLANPRAIHEQPSSNLSLRHGQ